MSGSSSDSPSSVTLAELAEARFRRWQQKDLQPERQRRTKEIDQQELSAAGRAVLLLRLERELLDKECRWRIGFYTSVARRARSLDMLLPPRVDTLREAVMRSVRASLASLQGRLERQTRAAGLPLPLERRYTQIESDVLDVVNVELRVLAAEGRLAEKPVGVALPEGTLTTDVTQAGAATGKSLVTAKAGAVAELRQSGRADSSIESLVAVKRVKDYMDSKAIGKTDFASMAQITPQTLLKFFKTGRLRRREFRVMAEAMGTTSEALLMAE